MDLLDSLERISITAGGVMMQIYDGDTADGVTCGAAYAGAGAKSQKRTV